MKNNINVVMKRVKGVLPFMFFSCLMGCQNEDIIPSSNDPLSQSIEINNVRIEGMEAITFANSGRAVTERSENEIRFVNDFKEGDLIALELVDEDSKSSYYYFKLSSAGKWEQSNTTPLVTSNLIDKTIHAHFIPGNRDVSAYSWKNISAPWQGEDVYPDILQDMDVKYDAEKSAVNINFVHAENGKLIVKLKADSELGLSQTQLDNAKVILQSSQVLSYYDLTSDGLDYGFLNIPQREMIPVDVNGNRQYELLLADISSYNSLFRIDINGDNYVSTVYKVNISSNKYSTIEMTLKLGSK